MISNAYEAILHELGELFQIPGLKPDQNNTCLLKMIDGTQIYIEPTESGEELIVGTRLGHIPPGGYRLSVFKAALQTNGLFPPEIGIFAWSEPLDEFLLFFKIHSKNLSGQMLHEKLITFLAKAQVWKMALAEGRVPIVQTETNKILSRREGLFGLRP